MGLRRRSRELALQFLFQSEFAIKTTAETALQNFAADFAVEPDVLSYASSLVTGILGEKNEIDGVIQACSAHWKIARMALVDINVMRIAVFEMKFQRPPVPAVVAINEAVDIAKKYGSTDSGSFVNGILDHVARDLR